LPSAQSRKPPNKATRLVYSKPSTMTPITIKPLAGRDIESNKKMGTTASLDYHKLVGLDYLTILILARCSLEMISFRVAILIFDFRLWNQNTA
jgi:hypothetical protein